jgi:hypothetical protein
MLRGHQGIRSAYLPLGARIGPKEIDHTGTIQITRPPFRESRAWATNIMGFKYRDHNVSLSNQAGCMVNMQ